MIPIRTLITNALCRLNRWTNRNLILPVLILYPTGRCNSRCISCDWWKRTEVEDLSYDEIETLASYLPSLGTRCVILSGGEPLLRDDIFDVAELFRGYGASVWLLTNGLLLGERAEGVVRGFSHVIVSLDAGSAELYREVRGMDGLTRVEAGVRRVREMAPHVPVTARATLHRANYHDLPAIIDKAKSMGCDSISFLPADISSKAFGRRALPGTGAKSRLVLSHDEVSAFASVVRAAATSHADDFDSRFIAQSPANLAQLPRYYGALRGEGAFPDVRCDAPWVSVVVEADGATRPCYFHPAVGNVRKKTLPEIVDEDLRAFRRGLDVSRDPVCQRCTCSLRVGLRTKIW